MIMTRYSIKTNSLNNTLNRVNLFAAIRKRTGSSPRGGREGASAPAGLEEASILVGRVGAFLFLLLFLSLSFSSCSTDDEGGGTAPVDDGRQTVQLYLSVQSSNATRIGDPGQAVPEGEDWDKLAVIVVYSGDTKLPEGVGKVDVQEIDFTRFNSLPMVNDNPNHRLYPLDVYPGQIYIYGVTYTESCGEDLVHSINACTTKDGVEALTISNDYTKVGQGDIDAPKFLSVATGFYRKDSNGQDLTEPQPFTVTENVEWTDENVPTITLTRLAAKIDIQWDAKEAYGSGYSDIKVTGFTFSGDNENVTGSGSGRLFPSLNEGSEKLSGSKTFINQTPISQRNGRVYHYVFPDGVSTPKVTFNITAKKEENGITTDVKKEYTYTFKDHPLQKATWYKIRTYINGFTNQETNITITPEGPKTVETE